MESEAPVTRAEGEILRDWRAETVQASVSTAACATCGCWDGGGTEE